MKISNSACSKYLSCGEMYRLHYIKKLRPNWTSSALLFGDAIDKALNELLLKTGKNPYETFIKGWTHGVLNKKPIYIPTSTKLLYANQDYNPDLLVPEDYEDIKKRITEGVIKEHIFTDLIAKKKSSGWDKFTEDEKSYYNYVNWLCMKRKAFFMIEGYKQRILPRIKKVHAIQKEIKAENSDGDEFTGFVDLICDIEYDGEVHTVIIDHKTSAREYDYDAVKKSQQLALYVHMEGSTYNTRKAGYIVMKKNLNYNEVKTCNSCGHIGKGSHKTCDNTVEGKRCSGEWSYTTNPEAEFQVIIDDMPLDFEEMVVENLDNVTHAIKANVFTKNLEQCHNHFGSTCPYLRYCTSKCKDMRGLVDETIP